VRMATNCTLRGEKPKAGVADSTTRGLLRSSSDVVRLCPASAENPAARTRTKERLALRSHREKTQGPARTNPSSRTSTFTLAPGSYAGQGFPASFQSGPAVYSPRDNSLRG